MLKLSGGGGARAYGTLDPAAIAERCGVPEVVVTLGSDGARVSAGGETRRAPRAPRARRRPDRCGRHLPRALRERARRRRTAGFAATEQACRGVGAWLSSETSGSARGDLSRAALAPEHPRGIWSRDADPLHELSGVGHLHPMLPLALAASGAGHDVVVASGPELVDWIEACGLSGLAAGHSQDELHELVRGAARRTAGRECTATSPRGRCSPTCSRTAAAGSPT